VWLTSARRSRRRRAAQWQSAGSLNVPAVVLTVTVPLPVLIVAGGVRQGVAIGVVGQDHARQQGRRRRETVTEKVSGWRRVGGAERDGHRRPP